MAEAELVQNGIAPGNVPFLAASALKVLGRHVVEAAES